MNIARSLLIRNQNVGGTFHRKFRFSAINCNSSESAQSQLQEEKFEFEDLKFYEREERRKAAINPFMKDVFLSVFNRDLMAYPEILNKDETEKLNNRASTIRDIFTNSEKTIEDKKNVLKSTKMYGGPVGLTNNGLAMNCTESLHYLESMSSELALSVEMSNHWVALEALKKGLSQEQYQQIIGDLITGEKTIALCVKETLSRRTTQSDLSTIAEMDTQEIWRISGEKLCSQPDGYFLVLCSVEAERMRAFLVHPGAHGTSFANGKVIFKKVAGTPLTNVTEAELSRILAKTRLHSACLIRSVLQRATLKCNDFVKNKVMGGQPLHEVSSIRRTMGEAVMAAYASESAEYFSAGLLDGYMDPDVELEMALCRNFIARHAVSRLGKLTEIFTAEENDASNQLQSDMKSVTMDTEFSDNVNIFVALNGLHHVGKLIANEVKQIRNPVFNPGFVIRKMIANRHQEKDQPKLDMYLAEHLHPTLRRQAENLEYSVLRMRFACEILMNRHGNEIMKAFPDLIRLSEAAAEILAMTAVLGRASRSYCIGVRNSETEIKLAACFVDQSKLRVQKLIKDIDDGEFINLDFYKINFGKKLIESAAIPVEPPTTRVYW